MTGAEVSLRVVADRMLALPRNAQAEGARDGLTVVPE